MRRQSVKQLGIQYERPTKKIHENKLQGNLHVFLLIHLFNSLTRKSFFLKISARFVKKGKKYGTLHEFACHPCAGAMLIFSVSFQF